MTCLLSCLELLTTMQVYSHVRAAWLLFMRSGTSPGSGDSWQFCALLQRDIDMVKDYRPACRAGAQDAPCVHASGVRNFCVRVLRQLMAR